MYYGPTEPRLQRIRALSLVRGECTTALYNRLAREKVAKAKREEEEEEKEEKKEKEKEKRKINRTSHKG